MAEVFDRVGDEFVAYYDTVRGHVREEVTRRNLLPYLGTGVQFQIADVGGGDGRDAVWLAERGHEVTLVDPSEEMIEKAQQRVAATGLEEKVEVIYGDPEEKLADRERQYDFALSHGVMMYLDEPRAHLQLLARVVKRRGTVSVLTKGKHGSVTRLLNKGDTRAAQQLMQTNRLINNLGVDVQAVDIATVRQLVVGSPLNINDWYGVRVATDADRRAVTSVDQSEMKHIVDLEHDLSRNQSTKGMGQMLHFILTKGYSSEV